MCRVWGSKTLVKTILEMPAEEISPNFSSLRGRAGKYLRSLGLRLEVEGSGFQSSGFRFHGKGLWHFGVYRCWLPPTLVCGVCRIVVEGA